MGKDIRGFDVAIARPCSVAWSSMSGTERARRCGLCQRSVYELSGLTRSEVESLVADEHGCVQFFQREDGTVLTSDCEVGVRVTRRREWLGLGVRNGIAGALSVGVGCLLGLCIVGLVPGPARPTLPAALLETQAQRQARSQREIARIEARDAAAPFTSKEYAEIGQAADHMRGCIDAPPEERYAAALAQAKAAKVQRLLAAADDVQRQAEKYLRDHPEPVSLSGKPVPSAFIDGDALAGPDAGPETEAERKRRTIEYIRTHGTHPVPVGPSRSISSVLTDLGEPDAGPAMPRK